MKRPRLLAGALLWVAACGAPAEESDPPRAATAAAAEPRVREEMLVDGDWLAGRLDDPEVVVLHVGPERGEYEQGHVPGARFLPLDAIVTQRGEDLNELPPVSRLDSVFEAAGVSDGSRVVVYGRPLAAARAFFALDYLGHGDRTALLDGGIEAWRAAGHPLSTAEPHVARGSFTARPQEERLVDAAWISERLDDPGVALLDARPEAQFTGAEAGAGVPRPGHIPGAGHLFWEETLDSPGQPTLEDPASLRAMFRAAGVDPGDTVVTYCRTGMQAGFAYFVARYLGYDARLYDGSFMDWSRRAGLPVER